MTPTDLPRHELVGLRVRIDSAQNPDLVGVAGRVVRETRNTLVVGRSGDGSADEEPATVPKAGTTFRFRLPADDSDDDDSTHVTVAGGRLVARPARRTKEATAGGGERWR